MQRFAIYFVPEPETALAEFGAKAIGYDVENGCDVAFHDHPFYEGEDVRAWTESPRRYGFHATLKAPFELADGRSPEDLLVAAKAFAAACDPVELGRLEVKAIGGFVALTVKESAEAVNAFAAACVRGFEDFRAPLSAADRERRLAVDLSDQHRAYIDAWGYPYVFDAFRFHMTLTGRLPDAVTVGAASAALAGLYQDIDAPVVIGAVTVAEQAERRARFRILGRYPLGCIGG